MTAVTVQEMTGRIHKERALALMRGQTFLRVMVQTNLGFRALYATIDLLTGSVAVVKRKKCVSIEQLAERMAALKPINYEHLANPWRIPRIEFRDGAGN